MEDSEREAARRELGNVPDSGDHTMVVLGTFGYVCATCIKYTGRADVGMWPCRPALLARVAALTEYVRADAEDWCCELPDCTPTDPACRTMEARAVLAGAWEGETNADR